MITYIVDLFSLIIEGTKTQGYDFGQSIKTITECISQNLINLGQSGASQVYSIGATEIYTILALVFCVSIGFILLRAFFGVFGLIRIR